MIIKIDPISTSHAHNAINYALRKNNNERGKEKPEFLDLLNMDLDDVTFSAPDPKTIWNLMKLHQSKFKFRRDEMFVRGEISPPMEICCNWSMQQWEECLIESLRHLDDKNNFFRKEVVQDKNGRAKFDKNGNIRYRIIGEPFNFRDCQLVAAIHRDTDHYHIHFVANRVTMDGKCLDMHRCHERAMKAADNYAKEKGWKVASSYENMRKARIHSDALAVLGSMDSFSLSEFFEGMRGFGWVVQPQTPDRNGVIHGYSIGEYVHPYDRTPLLYKASKLGYGRDLTVANLERTWQKIQKSLQEEKRVAEPEVPVSKPVAEKSVTGKVPMPAPSTMPAAPKTTAATPKAEKPLPKLIEPMVSYNYNGRVFEIPKQVDDYIKEYADLSDYNDNYDFEDDDWLFNSNQDDVAATAAALFAGIINFAGEALPGDTPSSGGGGGGGSSDKDDDWRNKADQAVFNAGIMHERGYTPTITPSNSKSRKR